MIVATFKLSPGFTYGTGAGYSEIQPCEASVNEFHAEAERERNAGMSDANAKAGAEERNFLLG